MGYDLSTDLQLKMSSGYTTMNMSEITPIPTVSFRPSNGNKLGTSIFSNSSIKTWILEPQIGYKKNWGSSVVEVLLGTTFQQNKKEGQVLLASGFTSDALLENIQAAPSLFVIGAEKSQYRYNALFGRVNYRLKNKFIFNATGRRDGSSRFGAGHQFGNFGALGFGWIFSNEGWVHNTLPFISYGKLRASYGTTGSDQIGDYQYLNTYSATSYPYQGLTGLFPTRLYNPDYSWESNRKLEIGIDLGFPGERLTFSASYYNHRSSDQLVGYALPPSTGFASIQYNFPAIVQNTGFEFELNAQLIKNTHLSWTTNFNLTIPRNQLVAFPGIAATSYANTYEVGKSLNSKKLLHYLNLDPQTGIYQFEDLNGNGSGLDIPADQKIARQVAQSFYGALENAIHYKSFELSFISNLPNKRALIT